MDTNQLFNPGLHMLSGLVLAIKLQTNCIVNHFQIVEITVFYWQVSVEDLELHNTTGL